MMAINPRLAASMRRRLWSDSLNTFANVSWSWMTAASETTWQVTRSRSIESYAVEL